MCSGVRLVYGIRLIRSVLKSCQTPHIKKKERRIQILKVIAAQPTRTGCNRQ
jgi:hypothetical protein